MQKIFVDLNDRSYDIYLDCHYINDIPAMITEQFSYKKVAIITDNHVKTFYLQALLDGFKKLGVHVSHYAVMPGESSKSMQVLSNIYDYFVDNKLTRKDLVITLGGGVVGDLGGYAAATYLRGIDFIQVPTSLLAQVDSSVGGKVAVNLSQGKNLVGCFYQPKAVYIDYGVLKTLPAKEFKSGMAEVLKYAFIKDYKLYELLSKHHLDDVIETIEAIIKTCIMIKADVVSRDEKEAGERMLLNFGHTFGHAIEKYFNYEKYTHGQAVGHGMYLIIKGLYKSGRIDDTTYKDSLKLLKQYDMVLDDSFDIERLMSYAANDKKSEGQTINTIFIKAIGESYIEKIEFNQLKKLLEATC